MNHRFSTSVKKYITIAIVFVSILFATESLYAFPSCEEYVPKAMSGTKDTPSEKDSANTSVSGAVNTNTQKQLKIGPVPTRSYLNVYLDNSTTGKVDIRIIDMNGRVVMAKEAHDKQSQTWNTQITVGEIASGLYFLELFVGDERLTAKFIKIGR